MAHSACTQEPLVFQKLIFELLRLEDIALVLTEALE